VPKLGVALETTDLQVGREFWHRGYKFSTFAHCWIRQAVERTIANQAKTIRLPIQVIKDGRLEIGG
jgi:hypothetical protein